MQNDTTVITADAADAAPAGTNAAIHLWSRTLIPTAKSAPADAEAASHKLLSRAGFVRRVGAGIYDYLPLGWRALQKISTIVREEMDGAGANEMLMPAFEPIELFAGTKRDVEYGDNLFRVTDRHGRELALAPTHEEVVTELCKAAVTSYKQLPLSLYQIQNKFRDEFRPRAGLLRGREFVMKDAYSFHMDADGPGGLTQTYETMREAYVRIFTRCGLDFTVVQAEAGPIGGSASHEFMVNCDAGEDVILRCPQSGYAANVEKCETGARTWSFDGEPSGDLEEVHTPGISSIADVSKRMKVKPKNMLKVVVYEHEGFAQDREGSSNAVQTHIVIAVVRGDHEANDAKVRDAVGFQVVRADEAFLRSIGWQVGYLSPKMAAKKPAGRDIRVRMVVDPDAARGFDHDKGKPVFWATGADNAEHHWKHFNWRRELGDVIDDNKRVTVADVRNARPGDPSPKAEGVALEASRGIEVGHIFQLGTKYSEAMGFRILDKDQVRRAVIMGCYGIGVSRILAACVEMAHDDDGIVWPAAIAPYSTLITVMDIDPEAAAMRQARALADELSRAGVDVLIDDRDERPGVKFKDADLIGIPVRVTVGERALDQGGVELKRRAEGGRGELVPRKQAVDAVLAALGR